MSDYEMPETPELDQAFREAVRALQPLLPARSYRRDAALMLTTEFIFELPHLVDEALMAAAGQLGPPISWEAERQDEFQLTIAGADLDTGDHDFGVVLSGAATEDECGRWGGSLDRAARAYRRESGWDFAPGEAGVWLLMLAPVSMIGGESDTAHFSYSGHLAGFVILYDRDEDGAYEAVGHVWTATAWRRHGIARQLLQEASSRFQFERFEGPYSADGRELVSAWEREHP